jgi:hypothetical protein
MSSTLLENLPSDLRKLMEDIQQAAQSRKGNCLELLQLLRMLEALHQTIRDEEFQPSLPSTRQTLYALLADIEEAGTWPHMPHVQLRFLLTNLLEDIPSKSPQ